jgi:adenine-specific DNA-methyltransferase
MSYKQRLELDWIGKDEIPHLEPRILNRNNEYSVGIKEENKLIHGDNLLGLKALESEYKSKIKLCFIDPPYNTGSAFSHYEDGVEHSLWLSLMARRIEIIYKLLKEDGSLWITIDDNEAHYLKVLCDEIFGRSNFVSNIIWQKKYSRQNDSKWFSTSHDHILVYAKNKEIWRPNSLPRTEDQTKGYKNPDNDTRGVWQSVVYTCSKTKSERPNLYYGIKHPKTGKLIYPSESRVWGYDENRHKKHVEENRIWWGKDQEKDKPRLKSFLSEKKGGIVPNTWWTREEAGDNQDAKREALKLNKKDTFGTPKPEKLLKRIITIGSNEGDIVLDSFAGSGTTGAVAHKMKRNWIMIEMGEQCHTHILPRMNAVVEGDGTFGVSKDLGWSGGGEFSYYDLAPSLLQKDDRGNWVINNDYDAEQLAKAVCAHEGFRFFPDEQKYWRQGYSSEKDFIFVTTQFLTSEHLDRISSQMKQDESLLVCAKAFRVKKDKHPNITLKKIPQMLLGRCEFGKDDYSLNIKEEVQEELNMDMDA